MSKAEELKEKAKIPNDAILAVVSVISKDETALDLEKEKKYRFTESELQQYVDKVSRERAVKFMKDIDKKTSSEMNCERCKSMFEMLDNEQYESMFDEWKSNQEQP